MRLRGGEASGRLVQEHDERLECDSMFNLTALYCTSAGFERLHIRSQTAARDFEFGFLEINRAGPPKKPLCCTVVLYPQSARMPVSRPCPRISIVHAEISGWHCLAVQAEEKTSFFLFLFYFWFAPNGRMIFAIFSQPRRLSTDDRTSDEPRADLERQKTYFIHQPLLFFPPMAVRVLQLVIAIPHTMVL